MWCLHHRRYHGVVVLVDSGCLGLSCRSFCASRHSAWVGAVLELLILAPSSSHSAPFMRYVLIPRPGVLAYASVLLQFSTGKVISTAAPLWVSSPILLSSSDGIVASAGAALSTAVSLVPSGTGTNNCWFPLARKWPTWKWTWIWILYGKIEKKCPRYFRRDSRGNPRDLNMCRTGRSAALSRGRKSMPPRRESIELVVQQRKFT